MNSMSNANLRRKCAGRRKVAEVDAAAAVCGNGIRLARAEKQFTELRNLLMFLRWRPGVLRTWCLDVPTFVGRPGNVAARGANFALQNCDFLLVLGARMDMAITGYAPQNLAREAYKVAVDIDPSELQKLYPHLQQPVMSDCRAFLDELLTQLRAASSTIPTGRPGTGVRDWKIRYGVVTDEHRKPEGLVSIFNLAEVIGTESKQEDKLVQAPRARVLRFFCWPVLRARAAHYHTAGLGSMGYGCRCRSASASAGGKQTILVDGDGASSSISRSSKR